MDHWTRIERALAGTLPQHAPPPVALWRHFPDDDQDPGALAARTVEFQRKWDFDLVKFMPAGTYGVEDWGAVSAYRGAVNGAREVVSTAIREVDDWRRIGPLDVRAGSLGRQNDALALAAAALGGAVPILQTVFSPLTTAYKLAGPRLLADLRRHPDAVEPALATITDVTIEFALEARRRGAHGLFFATQLATHRLLAEDEYRRFGRPHDLRVLQALGGPGTVHMLHAHGLDVMFDLLADYPVHIMNWHDRLTEPGLRDAGDRFPGLLAGGLEETVTLAGTDLEATRRQVRDALGEAPAGRLVVAPGCVLRCDVTDAQIGAVLEAAARPSLRTPAGVRT